MQWLLSFCLDRAATLFVQGLFAGQHLGLGDGRHHSDFRVTDIAVQPLPDWRRPLRLRWLSPVVVSQKRPGTTESYLGPLDAGFGHYLCENLLNKYHTYQRVRGETHPYTHHDCRVRVTEGERARAKLIQVKPGIRIRGFERFGLELAAPPEVLRVGFLAGIGRHNAQGFGCPAACR